MIYLQYVGEEIKYPVEFKKISKNIVQVKGDLPAQINGFDCISPKVGEPWKYRDFTTVYRTLEDGVQFSNDGSEWVAPPEPEPTPEPEPYVPTLDEVKSLKKSEIATAYQMTKAAGVEIELSTGIERFPLADEDTTFLMSKQMEILLNPSVEYVSYQDAENHCKMYAKSDMEKIIQTAMAFANYQTTYRNNLWEWVDECTTTEAVEAIYYGCEIPEEFMNDVLKSYLAATKEETDESS